MKCAELVELLTQSRVRNFNSLFLFLCTGALWAIWKTRNAWVFEDKLLKSPIELIYKTRALLMSWRGLQCEKDWAKLDALHDALLAACA